jgi:uncharacterized protein YndB with AHSA1/START domain
MTTTDTEIRSVVLERDVPHPPEKIWRALTQPHLLAEWLMKNDFAPTVGHQFQFSGDWGAADCKVLEVEPNRSLAYTWGAFGLESTVTWTLSPSAAGTHLRLEQAGFRKDQEQAYRGAFAGWNGFLAGLDKVLARID